MKSWSAFCFWASASLVLGSFTGCKNDQAKPELNPSPASAPAFSLSANEAQLKIVLHDRPIAGHEIEKVLIDIRRVSVIDQAGFEHVLSEDAQKFDLLELVNRLSRLIGLKILPPGIYSQIRLELGSDNSVITEGREEPLKIPSGESSGLKISREFELRGGFVTEISVDFDAALSIEWNKGQGFILKPVIKIDQVLSMRPDSIAPKVTLGIENGLVTKNAQVVLPVSIDDAGPVTTSVSINGEVVLTKSSIDGIEVFDVSDLSSQELNFSANLDLIEGPNAIVVRSSDYFANQGVASIQIVKDSIAPVISTLTQEGMLTNQPNFTLNVAIDDATSTVTSVLRNGSQVGVFNEKHFAASVTLTEGLNSFRIQARDAAGNESEYLIREVILDSIAPVVLIGAADHQLLRQSGFEFPVMVDDASPVTTRVTHNGIEVIQGREKAFSVSLFLHEGPNLIIVSSTDDAGNVGFASLLDIGLDTQAPTITDLVPTDGQVINSLLFSVSGKADEELSRVTVNGQDAALSADLKSFGTTVSVSAEGEYTLSVQASDRAGNYAERYTHVSVVLKVLRPELIAVNISESGEGLVVRGEAGAARPGASINVKTGFFTSESTTAGEDGSFQLNTSFFETATVVATAADIGRTDSAQISFNVDTRLIGTVKDTDGRPLPGARVEVVGSDGGQVITDAAGVFIFDRPITGVQTLAVDGTFVIDPCSDCARRKFTTATVNLSIGVNQSNVMSRAIYLAPYYLDGTDVEVSPTQDTVVTNPHAPGVELNVPAGAVEVAEGSEPVRIAMVETPVEATTVEPPAFINPKTVISLEPSGLTFTKPVQVAVPNDNELPPGTNVIIMSYDSKTGYWEPDGVGAVDEAGEKVVTKEGMGISHFSQIFVAPLGPKVAALGSQDQPGANTFDGAVSTTLKLPSHFSMGQEFAPSLTYKSSWAKPFSLVSTLVSIPRNEITKFNRREAKAFGYTVASGSSKVRAWTQPDFITGQFSTTGILTDKYKFTGIPNDAAVSFGVDLSALQTGVYPYLAHFEVHYKQTVVSTVKKQTRKYAIAGPLETETIRKTRVYRDFYQEDFGGPLFVQNRINSETGTGWRLNGAQRIANVNSDRIMIEESNGAISSYVLNSKIETMLNLTGTGFDALEASRIQWPSLYTSKKTADNKKIEIHRMNLLANDPYLSRVNLQTVQPLSGKIVDWWSDSWLFDMGLISTFHIPPLLADFLCLPGNECISSIPNFHGLRLLSGSRLGKTVLPPKFKDTVPANKWCKDYGAVCTVYAWVDDPKPSGEAPAKGLGGGTFGTAAFNEPKGMAMHPFKNIVALADYGNHRVVGLNLETQEISVIAGNGQNGAKRDGVASTTAPLIFPKVLMYDSFGNLFIATTEGYIRKVDTEGIISTVAGLPYNHQDAVFDIEAPASQVSLWNPSGMVLDEEASILYVADTNHNRVVAIDLTPGEDIATTVAGNFSPAFSGDGGPALDASLNKPTQLALDDSRNLIIVDSENSRIRRVIFQNTNGANLAFSPSTQDNSTLIRNKSDNTFVRRYRNGDETHFNADGTQSATTTKAGMRVDYEYTDGLLTGIVDPAGRRTIYEYSGELLQQIRDPAGRVTSFSYSGSMLSEVRLPDGSVKGFEYYPDGLLWKETTSRGETKYEYNQWGRLAKVIRADNSEVVVNDIGSGTAANNYTGGAVGELKSVKDGAANSVTVGGKTISLKVDDKGFIAKVQGLDGKITKIERNLKGQPVSVYRDFVENDVDTTDDDEWNSKATFSYNEFGDLIEHQDTKTGAKVSREYDTFGNVIYERNARGYAFTATFNPSNGLLATKTDAKNNTYEYVYYADGLLKNIIDPERRVVQTREYDAFGNLQKIKDALDNATTYSVDPLVGIVLSKTDARLKTTQYSYDDFNRITSVTTPGADTTKYAYWDTGELKTIEDAKENIVSFDYDNLGRLIKKTDGDYWMARRYNQSGQVAEEEDSGGNLKRFGYDDQDRLTMKTLPDDLIQLSYDTDGNVERIENNKTIVAYDYNLKGQLESATTGGKGGFSYPAVTLSFDYDENGNRTLMQGPHGPTGYYYDELDRLEKLVNPSAEVYQFGFDRLSRLESITRPGGSTGLAFDSTGFVTSIVHRGSGSEVVSSFGYVPDAIGNRRSLATLSGVHEFGYDDLGQLTSATHPEASAGSFQGENFHYDSLYNRDSDQGGTYTYDSRSQKLKEDYRYFYFYDSHGNLTQKQAKGLTGEVVLYRYSSENQLVGIKFYTPSGFDPSQLWLPNSSLVKEVTYTYDGLGRRVGKTVFDPAAPSEPRKSYTRKYVYDGEDILLEYDDNNSLLASYTHSTMRPDDVLGVKVTSAGVTAKIAQAPESYQYLKDAQGSVIDITDSGGHRLQHYVYSSFGVLLSIEDPSGGDIRANPALNTPYTYTGREYDEESGLYYYRARYYDPGTGRFLQKDPKPGSLNLPATVVNAYAYVGNNPLNMTDPTGMSWWTDWGRDLAIGIGATLTAIALGPVIGATLATGLAGGLVGGHYALKAGGDFFEGFVIGAIFSMAIGGMASEFVEKSVGLTGNTFDAMVIRGVTGKLMGSMAYVAFGDTLEQEHLVPRDSGALWGPSVGGFGNIPFSDL